MTAEEMRNEKYGPYVVANLQKRGFEACYVPTKAAALTEALSRIPEESLVSWGGSMSVCQIGLIDAVKTGKYRVLDRDAAKTPEERTECMRQALLCDVFLTSANAVSEDGCLVNVDGNGNRVAAITYGPRRVIVVVGMNKIVPTVQDGVSRIRSVAAPVNRMRFLKDDTIAPCARTGRCADCNAPDSICNHWVVTRRSLTPGRIHVIVVGESLGF